MEDNDIKRDESNGQIDGPFSSEQINSDMSQKEAYFKLLRAWVNQANMSQNAIACFPLYLMSNYPQLFQNQVQQTTNISNTNQGNLNGRTNNIGRGNNERRIGESFENDLRQEQIINQHGGFEFVIAPLWKRFTAEFIDVVILLLFKLLISFFVADIFDLHFGIDFDLDALKKSLEDDYTEFLSLSSDILILEIIVKIVVCLNEAFWTMSGNIYVGGATPGKYLVGIRIIHAEAVVTIPNNLPAGINLNNTTPLRALVYPATNPGFKRALFRSIAKNILLALLFPMCFVILFFKNNRTVYDIMTKTIVVEENHAPVLRRR